MADHKDDFSVGWSRKYEEGYKRIFGNKKKEENKMRRIIMQIGGIYEEYGEYSLSDGKNLFLLFDGISHIKCDTTIAPSNPGEHLVGYCLSINRATKEWRIRDTGHKKCKHILASGKYEDGFEESLKPILSLFNK